MKLGLVCLAICLASLASSSCNGRFDFDVETPPSNAFGSAGSDAGVAADAMLCALCEALGFYCTGDASECAECLDDDDCTEAPSGAKYCDPMLHRCTLCRATSGCEHGQVCDGWSHECVRSCATEVDPDHDCDHSTLTCDLDRSVCLACRGDEDCEGSAEGPHCVPGGSRCAACVADTDCDAPAPHCDPLTFACVLCRDARDCAAGTLCDPRSQACTAG